MNDVPTKDVDVNKEAAVGQASNFQNTVDYFPQSIGGQSCASASYPPVNVDNNSIYNYSSSFALPQNVEADNLKVKTITCSLPEDAAERFLMYGAKNNKGILKAKLREAYKEWVATQRIPVAAIPIILLAAMQALDVSIDEEKTEQEK